MSRIAIVVATFLLMTSLSACDRAGQKTGEPTEKVTIAFVTTTDAVLADVAQANGFFRQEGLEVTPHLHPYGKLALEDLLAGGADFATVAETPIMFAIMNGEKISIISTIQTSNTGFAVLARKDKGILRVDDLKGKKIGVTLGTTSDFILDVLLGVNGMTREDVQVVDLKAELTAEALARGDIDAVSTFTTYVNKLEKLYGDSLTTFQDKDLYRIAFNVVAKQDFINSNPGKVNKILRALVRAEEFVKNNPGEASKNVADFTGVDIGSVHSIWPNTVFAVTLDQPLIVTLEDESRWAMNNELIRMRKIPNYLDFIYMDGLKTVKPVSVKVIR